MATSYPPHLDALRRAKPALVRIHTVDGETKDVRVPDRRNRWGAVAKIIDAHSWTRLEGIVLDKQKRESVVAIIDNDGPASGIEDISPKGDLVATMLQLMLKGQEVALRHQAEAFGLVLPELRNVASVVTEAVTAMVHSMRASMEMWQRSMMGQASGGQSASEQLLEHMMPDIAKRLSGGIGITKPKGEKPATPKNGTPPATEG